MNIGGFIGQGKVEYNFGELRRRMFLGSSGYWVVLTNFATDVSILRLLTLSKALLIKEDTYAHQITQPAPLLYKKYTTKFQ